MTPSPDRAEVPPPGVTIVVVTRNRKDDLRKALQSSVDQDVPCEVLVMDDCSDDGSPDMVRREFPGVRLVAAERSSGYIAERNFAAAVAKGDILFSIDDDAEFSSRSVVRQTLTEFTSPRVAAVSIPHIDVHLGPSLKTPVPPSAGRWVVSSYVGTAHAVRRDAFLQLGGYRAALTHNTEEREFCTRLLNCGYVTVLGTADPIFHYASPVRQGWRNQMLERRNDLLHALWNVPFPHLLYHVPGTIAAGLRFASRRGALAQTLTGYLRAVPLMWRMRHYRDPIAPEIYRLIRRLNRQRVLPLSEVEAAIGAPGVWPGRGPGTRPDWQPPTDMGLTR